MKVKTAIHSGDVQTLCRQCGMHCGVNVHIRDGRIVDVSGQDEHPINRGSICVKGQVAKELFYHQDRLLKPLNKRPDGSFLGRDRKAKSQA